MENIPKQGDILFIVTTPLKFRVKVTRDYWNIITTVKHPVMTGHEQDVKATLRNPDEIRQSRSDSAVFLFYKKIKTQRFICVVAKKLDTEGFLITTYPTNAIKEGEKIWQK